MMTHARNSLSIALGALLAGCGAEGPAAITVSTVDGPAQGVDVVFHDANGAPTKHVITGADGRAEADVEEGAMITVLMVDGNDRYRVTFVGVEPDDELTFVSPRIDVEVVGTARVTVGEVPGAAMYTFDVACSLVYTGAVAEPIEIEVRSNCLSPDGTFHLLVTAYDAEGEPIARSALRDLEWVEPMDVTMPAWGDMAAFTFEATNAPAGALGVMAQLSYDANGVRFSGPSEGVVFGSGGAASLSLPYAPGFGDFIDTQIGLFYGEAIDALDRASMILERRATLPATRDIDLGAELLPPVSVATLDAADPVRPEISWTADALIAETDGGALVIAWTGTAEDGHEWAFLLPPDPTLPLKVPALPAELATWAPDATVDFGETRLMFVDADWIDSYDELRSDVGLAFLFDGDEVIPDADAMVKVVMSGDL